MIKRITAVALAVGLLGSVATAEAAVKAGVYRGKTEQNAKVSLKVLNSKRAVIKFNWEGVVMGCSDGNTRQLAGFVTPASERIPLSRSGRFEFTATPDSGAFEFVTVGRVKGNRATGALQVQARVNEQEQLDPQGSITCDSEIVEWTARRR